MKRIFVIVLLSLLFAGQASADMIIKIGDSIGTVNAGEFAVTLLNGYLWGGNPLYSDPIGDYVKGDTFASFCVETDEYVYLLSRPYYVELNTYAVRGGSNTNDNDPLDPRSAWIYTQWMTQTQIDVDNIYGTFTISHDDAGANMVQRALWDIEDEGDYTSFTGVSALIKEAEEAGWTTIGNVRVMNLWQYAYDGTKTEVYSQDLLVLVPLPATILLGFIGLGIGGLKLRKSVK
ncbi:MAG: hypothetical protein JW787_14600 [Sedimentisphaerales bacterium]|nr:hypothetical protein [Sedimentisphaerales bacterium]